MSSPATFSTTTSSSQILGTAGWESYWLATHQRLHRKAAIKVLSADNASDPDARARFLREPQLAAALDHPNIISIYDAGEDDGRLFIAMRYIEGSDLRAHLRDHGTLTLERTLDVAARIADALDAAHGAGLVHRDVKPSNILLARSGDGVYLTDFGIAKQSSTTGLTTTGSFLGTVDYCAPEQIEGSRVDGRSDIYSLGAVVFHCLTGNAPFVRTTEMAVLKAHLVDPPPALSNVRPDLPRALDGPIVTAMAKHPEVRFETAREFAEALSDAASESPRREEKGTSPPRAWQETVADAPDRPTNSADRKRRRTWVIALVAMLALAALGGAVAALALGGGSSGSSTQRSSPPPTLPGASYDALVRRPLAQLQSSANVVGTGLGTTVGPRQLPRLRRTLSNQLTVVQGAWGRFVRDPAPEREARCAPTPGSRCGKPSALPHVPDQSHQPLVTG